MHCDPCFLAGDQSTITAEDLEGQFQAIRRLVASKAGFQAFTTLPKYVEDFYCIFQGNSLTQHFLFMDHHNLIICSPYGAFQG